MGKAVKAKATAAAVTEDQLVMLDPKQIDATGDNGVRYDASDVQNETLKASIVAQGRVNDPVEVCPMVNGKYPLTVGFGRYRAVCELNATGAGLKLPAIIRTTSDSKARLTRQLSENVDRQSLSPMDQATAIKALLAAGYTALEVRTLFSRPGTAGKKGAALLAPASNAWMNMILSMLELPKAIQAKIHSGAIGVAAAYELTKVSPDKQAAVLAKAEANRQAELDREAAADEKLAKAQEKLAKASQGSEASQKKLADAEAALTAAELAHNEANTKSDETRAKLKEIGKLSTADFALLKPEEKKAEGEKIGAAKADFHAGLKVVAETKKALTKAQDALKKITDKQAGTPAPKAKAAPVKAEAPKPAAKPRPVGSRDVKTAAAEVGAGAAVPATLSDARKAAAALGGSKYKGARAIGAAWLKFLDGKQSVGSLVTAVEVATGERTVTKA